MWELQGMLLYKTIEHQTHDATRRDGIRDDDLVPYADIIRDPRVNPEEAKKIAA